MSCDLTGTWRSRQPTSLQACSRRIWTRALSAELLSPMDNVQVVGPVDFDAWLCAEQLKAETVKPRHRNPPACSDGPKHWEIWLRDPDGYIVVVRSPDGSADGQWS